MCNLEGEGELGVEDVDDGDMDQVNDERQLAEGQETLPRQESVNPP